jgi:signal transduction histidine kinase
MLRRLHLTYLTLLAVVLVVLVVPLCISAASGATKDMYVDREADAARFASIADEALLQGEARALQAELSQYHRIYGIDAVVVGRNQDRIAASGTLRGEDEQRVAGAVARVLANERMQPPTSVWPWDDRSLVIVEPVVRSGQVVGAAATVSPTRELRGLILRRWVLLLALSLLVLGAGALAGRPLARWVLRPLRDLADCTRAISSGRLTARAPVASGPEEVRSLARSFNTMADEVCELLERQRLVVAYASHQVRNPLAAVRLQVEALAEEAPDAVDATAALDEIERLAGVCDSLLALADTECRDDEMVVIRAHEVTRDRLRVWAPLASRRGVTLIPRDIEDAWALTLPATLDQVLDALIDNGTKFAGAGGAVAVSLATAEPGTLLVAVDDSGPGLPPGLREQALQPFWRRTEDAQRAGSGLGLAVVVALLSRSGGSLSLSAGPLGGLRATARFRAVPCRG